MKSIALASFVFIGLIQIAVSFTTHHTIKLHLKPLAHLIRQSNHDSLQLRRRVTLLTTKETSDDEHNVGPLKQAVQKFKARPRTYLIIPCVAALVGWFTNYLAVKMIFYPIKFWGIPIWCRPEIPLGFIGWQGIVPCKTRPMSEVMVNMVTEQLLSVQEVFMRLDPRKVGRLLAPEVPKLTKEIIGDLALPHWIQAMPGAVFTGLSSESRSILKVYNVDFLTGLTKAMQHNINSIFNIRNCVVNQMLLDRSLLGQLFYKCGSKELDFLTNSGLWLGFVLGLIQMVIALFWENPWLSSIGGAIVGYATNWLALKWIFEPVNPTKFGPFILQGQFLRRQKEVSAEFSQFFAQKILNSQQLWNSILSDPSTTPAFYSLFSTHFSGFLKKVTGGLLRFTPEPEVVDFATKKVFEKLPEHVGVLHSYIDKTLNLENSLRVKMEAMTSTQFERVLHPIFEEDELTLVLAGAVLGFAAGLIQQGFETGQIDLKPYFKCLKKRFHGVVRSFAAMLQIRRGDKNGESKE